MKKNNIQSISLFFTLLTCSLLGQTSTLRNPFEFKQLMLKQESEVLQKSEILSKWNIREHGDELIVVENIDDGQIRTIEIGPFDH